MSGAAAWSTIQRWHTLSATPTPSTTPTPSGTADSADLAVMLITNTYERLDVPRRTTAA